MNELKKYYEIVYNEINNFTNNVIITTENDKNIYQLLKEFSLRGKLIRGSLILAINELLTGKINDNAIKLALSVELMHSSILIVDDIIDNDDLRRGKPSMHILVKKLLQNSKNLDHDAKSVAQCIALIGTYHSYNLVSNICSGTKIIVEEFTKTGLAELNEIILQQKRDYNKNDIFLIYENKTARYTITLPFKLAFFLSNEEFTNEIERITILLGIIFQLKDDLLEIEFNSTEIGKSDYSDIKSGKKHYPRMILENNVNETDKKLLENYYLKQGDDSVKKIKLLYEKYDVLKKVNNEIKTLNDELDILIEKQNPKIKLFLLKLKEYIYTRKK
jgi:geranylgeranyl diphosphate synthase, type I